MTFHRHLLSGVVAGTPLALTGIISRTRADATAIDAVNLYNDERATCLAREDSRR